MGELVIQYGRGDATAALRCLRVSGVGFTDMLVRGAHATCIAQPTGKGRDEIDELVACLRAAGAVVTEDPDDKP